MAARRVVVLGGGSFGSVVARIAAEGAAAQPDKFCATVDWWVRRQAQADEINATHRNATYVGACALPANLVATADLRVAEGADLVIVAVPHEYLDTVLSRLKGSLAAGATALSLVKGLHVEGGALTPLTARIADLLGVETAMLGGPNIYGDGARRDLLTTPTFRADLCDDVVGVDLCGSLKNCVTLACGFVTGLGLGMNAKSAAMRRGFGEVKRICVRFFGVDVATFDEACGFGDMVLSCSVGRGQKLAAAFVTSDKSWPDLEAEAAGEDGGTVAVRSAAPPRPPLLAAFEPPAKAFDLAGGRALVTGASGGIGKAIVAQLLAAGARVLAVDYGAEALKALKSEFPAVDTLALDLSRTEAAMAAVEAALEAGGPARYVVHCAGIAKFEPVLDTSPAEFDRQYGVNVKPAIFVTQIVAGDLVAKGLSGSVVHVSSQSSTLALEDHLVYSSSKAAVDHVARIQALEYGKHGIRVNTVNPTVVMTELAKKQWPADKLAAMKATIPLRKLAEPDDVANAVAFLLSDKAAMVSGIALPVDGGRSMGGHGL
ncbi:L-xylulose reductase [Aureococcus anophagefferens]|nr:L-xylulose reductase [Aureococcus anophagefferens]